MIRIIYYSITGNTKAFAERFTAEGFEVEALKDANPSEPFVLFTPTYTFGEVPVKVQRFLEDHSEYLAAVVSFGNRNWGEEFGKAGDVISTNYGVPLLYKVELRGVDKDFHKIRRRLSDGIG